MKKTLFILLLISTNLMYSQEIKTMIDPDDSTDLIFTDTNPVQIGYNVLTTSEFNNILIWETTLGSIINSRGDQTIMNSLFGNPIAVDIDNFGDFIDYKYLGVNIYFSSMFNSAGEMEIASFKIINTNASITIKGINIKLGDNISKLGNIKFNLDKNGDYSILFQACEGCDSFIVIDFDQDTKLITKIYLLDLT
ncbi:MAG: hypothetical protein JW857_10960 [Bacteroidales bacterium]|nr:hypothetical protein [Bacteroidales bacterium]